MKPVKIGLIGPGFYATTVHLPALALVPELQLVAIAASRPETAQAAAARYRVDGYHDYRVLLSRADIEGVVISASTGQHETMCRESLAAGKHIFTESPGSNVLPAAVELQDEARRRGLVVQVGFLTRYNEAFDVLRMHLDSQPPPRLFTYEYFPFVGHTYNLALFLSGPYERVVGASASDAGIAATIAFRNGDTAVVIGRTLANCSVDIESVRVSTPTFYGSVEGRQRVRIIEEMRPTSVGDWNIASSAGATYCAQPFATRFHENSGAAPQLRGFAAAIRDGVAPRSTLADAIETELLMREIAARSNAA